MAIAPASAVMMAITLAKIGRWMKNRTMVARGREPLLRGSRRGRLGGRRRGGRLGGLRTRVDDLAAGLQALDALDHDPVALLHVAGEGQLSVLH
ncbi:MAG: hypothetical protein ACK56I_11715, partial [bacterium]